MEKLTNREYSVRTWSALLALQSPGNTYQIGYVTTPHGVVGIYSQPGKDAMTSMDVAFGGRCYSRTWRQTFSERGLKTIARRYAAEIAGRAALSKASGEEK